MLISHRYKFIFTKTVKTAGTSVESYFERFCMPEGEWHEQHQRESYESESGVIVYRGKITGEKPKWYHHMPARQIKTLVGDDIWNSYFKFTVIRNPWDKAMSAYSHFGKNYKPKLHQKLFQQICHSTCTPEQRRFLNWLKHEQLPEDRNTYLINNEICVDEFIRFENLHDGIESVCNKLGLPWDENRLPKFKTKIRDNTIKPHQIYTPAAHQRIEKHYAYEIKNFAYCYSPE
tara:strand:- start:1107 stop:1802 length:696 start_codon:yes stop_codon:yes gene_type:complete